MIHTNRGDRRRSEWCGCDQYGRQMDRSRYSQSGGFDDQCGTLAAAAYWDCIGVKEGPFYLSPCLQSQCESKPVETKSKLALFSLSANMPCLKVRFSSHVRRCTVVLFDNKSFSCACSVNRGPAVSVGIVFLVTCNDQSHLGTRRTDQKIIQLGDLHMCIRCAFRFLISLRAVLSWVQTPTTDDRHR